jgi:large subunit ribosomal protein L10
LAFSKQAKEQMQSRYADWLDKSQAVVLLEFHGMTMKDMNVLRAKVRDAGGEIHVVKNTVLGRAMQSAGIHFDAKTLEGPVAVSYAFSDPPGLAKVLSDATAKSEIFKIKGGFLGKQALTPVDVKSLADLPPLPVMRARLLGVLQAPATQLVRTISEPARSLAAVVKAYSEKQTEEAQPAAV